MTDRLVSGVQQFLQQHAQAWADGPQPVRHISPGYPDSRAGIDQSQMLNPLSKR